MASSDTQPNILFIITDHHAYFGHYLQDRFTYDWPQFESFTRDGVFFRRAYSVCSICTPARASMMTGVYPNEHGLVRNTDAGNSVSDFVQGQILYSHYLSQAGYRNAYIGKWHCGGERLPMDYGMEGWSLPHYGNIYNSVAYNDYCKKNGYGKPRATIEHCVNHPNWEGKDFVIQDGDCVACHGGLWEKDATFNEEMARVPLAIRWPEKIKGGTVCDKLVSNLDVTATLLDAAGVPVPDSMQSRSMLPLCRDPQCEQWPEYVISQHFGHGQLLCQRFIVSGKYKYAAALYDMDELYDLENDPYETNNLIDSPKHKDVKDGLRSAIIRHLEQKERTRDPQSIKLLESLKLGF